MVNSMNQLTVELYNSVNTRLAGIRDELEKIQNIRFSTGYPGGRYLDASFFIPMDVLDTIIIKQKQRVMIRNGVKAVYEGWIDGINSIVDKYNQGVEVNVVGAWGLYAMRRYIRKNWADNRITEDVWKWAPAATGANKCDVDRQARLRFMPKNEDWLTDEFAAVIYTMPTGQTVKKITYDYDLQEGAQAWQIAFYDATNGLQSIATSTGTASSQTYTLSTPVQALQFRFISKADQTPTSDGTYYGEISNVMVYSETSAINLTEIATDIVGWNTDINSDTVRIGSNTLDLSPFIIDRWESLADVLTQAADFGDSSFNRWGVGFVLSTLATSPDGKPALSVAQYPALTDYDYAIRFDDPNLVAPIQIERDFSSIYNWIVVEWYDEEGNYNVYTPDDDANLKDATSIAAYYQRDYVLNVGNSTQTAAINSGRRFLAAYKDPQYTVNGPITVNSYIRTKSGARMPCSEMQAGYRIKIENYLNDLSGTGLTFMISQTDYDDESQTCNISIGPPSDLIFPRFVFAPKPPPNEPIEKEEESTPGGGAERLNWKRKVGLKPGTPEWEEAVRIGKKAWYKKYRNKDIW